jgi:hypothetical protein
MQLDSHSAPIGGSQIDARWLQRLAPPLFP